MTNITVEHKREYREARQAAIDAVARLNALFAETGRSYRAVFEMVPFWPDDDAPDDDEVSDDDDGASDIRRQGAEREDEVLDI